LIDSLLVLLALGLGSEFFQLALKVFYTLHGLLLRLTECLHELLSFRSVIRVEVLLRDCFDHFGLRRCIFVRRVVTPVKL